MSRFPQLESWRVDKPAVYGARGVVCAQHYQAAEVGAEVLRTGGNAIDAAVATSFALGAVEPWMSGLGGGGYLLFHERATNTTHRVHFGMVAPLGLEQSHYPLVKGTDSDLFAWPRVVDDNNVKGPLSIAVPGQVAGMSLALKTFGTRGWRESIEPAIELARQGMDVDWYATLKIAGAAPDLAEYEETSRVYLPGGFPPAADWASPLPRVTLGNLASTLETLATVGPTAFYQGEIGESLVEDVAALGGVLSMDDLCAYSASLDVGEPIAYRDAAVYTAPELTAGPTLAHALSLLETSQSADTPLGAEAYGCLTDALVEAYEHRLASLGDVNDSVAPSSTTHLSVVDAEGNLVALTQTLLSVFGSRVMLPGTGLLMNNGIMWFDPRPGHPNSMAAGKKPLSNMCPTVVRRSDDCWFALGASGGRRIMPAVFQLISFLVDHQMSLHEAAHTARIDYSGADLVTVNNRLGEDVIDHLRASHPIQSVFDSVYPSYFACPNVVGHDNGKATGLGAAFVTSPWARAVPA